MRIGIVSALGRIGPDGVEGYGGLERASFWMANALAAKGHDVLLFGNIDDGKSKFGWTGVHLITEADALTADHMQQVRSCDAVNDWCHSKPLRLAKLKNYWATVMFTDQPAIAARNIYPSAAVRESFKDAAAPIIPIGIPLAGSHTDLPKHDGGVVCFGRITQHKGVDLSIDAARRSAPLADKFTVAGHVWPGIDEYYSMAIAKACRDLGYGYEPDPPNARAEELVRRASHLFHLHRWLESFSIVAAEALCYGTPILTTDVGAPQEWVRATDGGMTLVLGQVEKGEETTMVKAFLTDNWDGRRSAIAKRARDMFSIDRVVPRYERLFEEGMRR